MRGPLPLWGSISSHGVFIEWVVEEVFSEWSQTWPDFNDMALMECPDPRNRDSRIPGNTTLASPVPNGPHHGISSWDIFRVNFEFYGYPVHLS